MGSSEGKAVTSRTSHTLTGTCENDCFFFFPFVKHSLRFYSTQKAMKCKAVAQGRGYSHKTIT